MGDWRANGERPVRTYCDCPICRAATAAIRENLRREAAARDRSYCRIRPKPSRWDGTGPSTATAETQPKDQTKPSHNSGVEATR